jgi:hypothetical protein
MQHDKLDRTPIAEAGATPSPTTARAERQRERLRIQDQIGRSQAAGGKPSEDAALRMIADFYARGGRATACPPADDEAPGTDGERSRSS